ncbi:MAG: hypothetical protein M1823_007176, partial [Watsoniomyces obsoletus]
MLAGGGSGGTAGGIKVGTLAVLVMAVVAEARGDTDTDVMGRRLAPQVIRQALAVLALTIAVVVIASTVVLRVADDIPTSSTSNQTTPPSPEIHVKALLAASSGTCITRLRPHDTVGHSGSYRRSACAFEVSLRRGSYTLICSTFDEQQYAKFTLDFYSGIPQYPGVQGPRRETQASISALPSEGAGRLGARTPLLTFTASVN